MHRTLPQPSGGRRDQMRLACQRFLDALPALEQEALRQMARDHQRQAWQEVAAAIIAHAERWLSESS